MYDAPALFNGSPFRNITPPVQIHNKIRAIIIMSGLLCRNTPPTRLPNQQIATTKADLRAQVANEANSLSRFVRIAHQSNAIFRIFPRIPSQISDYSEPRLPEDTTVETCWYHPSAAVLSCLVSSGRVPPCAVDWSYARSQTMAPS